MKKVLFVSYNKHQRMFFNAIITAAKNEDIVYEHMFVGKARYRFLKKINVFSKVIINKDKLDRVCSYEKAIIISEQKRYPNFRISICENIAKRLYDYFLKYLR